MASSSGDNGVTPASAPIKVLFVCLGNICRSPMAHAVFENMVSPSSSSSSSSNVKFVVDSAGTGAYHTGDSPDPRTLWTLERHGIAGFTHPARKIRTRDFVDFDYVFAMDENNFEDLQAVRARAEREAKPDAAADGDGKPGLAVLIMFGAYGDNRKGKKFSEGRGEEIDDPYYGGDRGFEKAFEQCEKFSKGFLAKLLGEDWEKQVAGAKM